ncbi:MAG: replication-associated recombination protein A [Oligoflexia bacterium]|nr:replication-associated recombination protein A [Oligoflexia bacterium]
MSENLTLFENAPSAPRKQRQDAPLAEKLRPASWEELSGLENVDPSLLTRLRGGVGTPPSMLLWGPPGCGKTTLARLVGKSFAANFVEYSAVMVGIKEVRELVAQASRSSKPTILFLDEIHRFNRAQQDAFLPHLESGVLVLIGATTENPSFHLNPALLSRMKVVVMKPLSDQAQKVILEQAERRTGVQFAPAARDFIFEWSGGDARKLIGAVDIAAHSADLKTAQIGVDTLKSLLGEQRPFYDRDEEHYNAVSAFIKSMRASDPDAALYWGFHMLEAGDDPFFVLRRMIIFASEDIGNADPQALPLTIATAQAFERLGFPEARIPIAQCIIYLARAAKDRSSYDALNRVVETLAQHPNSPVPMHLRNATTELMKAAGYGAGKGEALSNLPKGLEKSRFYFPPTKK